MFHKKIDVYRPRGGVWTSSLLLIAVVLYQFGPSYHVSFGSLGLLVVFLFCGENISKQTIIVAGCVVLSFFLSYSLNVIQYGESGYFLRVFRYALNAAALFLILNRRGRMAPPSEAAIIAAVIVLTFLCLYQSFVDIGLRPPASWYALDRETDSSSPFFNYRPSVFRVSGIYTEPSEFGMILCVLLALSLQLKSRFRNLVSSLCGLSILLSGSLLGLVGLAGLIAVSVGRGRFRFWHLVGIAVLILVSVSIVKGLGEGNLGVLERSYRGGGFFDDSTTIRLINPFILIWYNFYNLDVLGFPGDIYTHFLWTGLYNSHESFPGHNGFLGVVMTFGIAGIASIFWLFRNLVTREEVFLVILIGSQSGNFFSYEKIFLMLFCVFVIRSMKVPKFEVVEGKKVACCGNVK